jgi:hypothetical protein
MTAWGDRPIAINEAACEQAVYQLWLAGGPDAK